MSDGLASHWRAKHKGRPQPPNPVLVVRIQPVDDIPHPLPLEFLDHLTELVAIVGPNVAIALNNNSDILPAAILDPVVASPLVQVPVPLTDLGLLVARFRYGLYRFHPT